MTAQLDHPVSEAPSRPRPLDVQAWLDHDDLPTYTGTTPMRPAAAPTAVDDLVARYRAAELQEAGD